MRFRNIMNKTKQFVCKCNIDPVQRVIMWFNIGLGWFGSSWWGCGVFKTHMHFFIRDSDLFFYIYFNDFYDFNHFYLYLPTSQPASQLNCLLACTSLHICIYNLNKNPICHLNVYCREINFTQIAHFLICMSEFLY